MGVKIKPDRVKNRGGDVPIESAPNHYLVAAKGQTPLTGLLGELDGCFPQGRVWVSESP